MKRLGLTIFGVFLLLGIVAPMITAEARHSGAGISNETSSWHSVEWGHNGTQAVTGHTQRHARATASVARLDTGLTRTTGAQVGQTARVTITMGSNILRWHHWGTN